MTLQGQRIVILGGSSGIGFATAEAAAAEGAELVIASSSKARVQEALTRLPAGAQGQALDLTDEAAVKAFFASLGAFDHLVFTAGETLQLGTLGETDIAVARGFFSLRYWGAFMAAKIWQPLDPARRLHRLHLGPCRRAPAPRLVARRQHLLGDGRVDAGARHGAGADPGEHRLARRGEEPALVEHERGRPRRTLSARPRNACRSAMSARSRRSRRPIST